MKISDLSDDEISARLRAGMLYLQTGPFITRITSADRGLAEGVALLYAEYPTFDAVEFPDFHIRIDAASRLRRWFRPQVDFLADGLKPFHPFPARQALPLYEWGANWCIGRQVQQYLIIHAAAIERDGHVAILPAPPGSGKSTLCCALVNRGWRLLSDELAMITLDGEAVVPLVRPISLKNESIAIMRDYVPDAVISRETPDTGKGTVALMRAPSDSIARAGETAKPAWIVFPQYYPGAAPELTPRPKAPTCLEIGQNAFNYSVLGKTGFEVLSRVIDRCDCYEFMYSRLDDAVEVFAGLKLPDPAAAPSAGAGLTGVVP